MKAYARGLIERRRSCADFEPFAAELAAAGERAALGQLLLKLTVPGLPDIYNGDELPLLSLVDPDNRRPVDWERAARGARRAAPRRGRPETRKLLLIVRALSCARAGRTAFAGAYAPLEAADGVCAFVRGGEVLVVVAGARPAPASRRARAGATCWAEPTTTWPCWSGLVGRLPGA